MFDKAVECIQSMLKIGLLALFIQSPIYATDPIDFDPDPNSTTTIVVQASEEEGAIKSLPPGRYMIIVVDEDGSTEVRQIDKQ